MVSVILMSLAAYANYASIVTSISVVSGIVASSVFLLMISIVGLIGASKHHQVCLNLMKISLYFFIPLQIWETNSVTIPNIPQIKNLIKTRFVVTKVS